MAKSHSFAVIGPIWEHVNPDGRFEVDMQARLPID
jgi:hypothetical protein